jgi:hypothetical protein
MLPSGVGVPRVLSPLKLTYWSPEAGEKSCDGSASLNDGNVAILRGVFSNAGPCGLVAPDLLELGVPSVLGEAGVCKNVRGQFCESSALAWGKGFCEVW